MDNWIISFGPFRVTRSRRLLERDGEPVQIGSRAFDILAHLLEHPGQVVSHRTLLDAAWPGTTVEGGNLRFQITALRKVLGSSDTKYIVNVPGRGYCFIAPVSRKIDAEQSAALGSPNNQFSLLPRPTRLVGRAETVSRVSSLVGSNRVVTIVAPGGMGKTSVAIVAATHLEKSFRDGVCYVELGLIDDAGQVVDAIAMSLGLPQRKAYRIEDIVETLHSRHLLILIDGCEQFIEEVALLVEKFVASTSTVHVLATTREALRIQHELVFNLDPLASAPLDADISAATIISYPAAQLFWERTMPAPNSRPTDSQALLVARICSKLDGLPLAIELAAAQAQLLGFDRVADELEERFPLSWPCRRTGPPRHQTLGAMLDWSYRLLSDDEKKAFRFLSIFSGSFDLDAASAVWANDETSIAAPNILANLVLKSVVSTNRSDFGIRYRLLDTSRAYARSKLIDAVELNTARRRLAHFCLQALQTGHVAGAIGAKRGSPVFSAFELDDLRAALDWAYTAQGDANLALAMTIGAIPLWMHLSLMEECRRRVEQALSHTGLDRTDRQEMQLYAALGAVLLERGSLSGETEGAIAKTYELADRSNDTEYCLRALWMLWSCRMNIGEYRASVTAALEFSKLASEKDDANDRLVGDRMLAASLHVLGDQAGAFRLNQQVLDKTPLTGRLSEIERFKLDQRAQAMSLRASMLWLLGFPDQAKVAKGAALDSVLSGEHASSICAVLVHSACPLALYMRDNNEAHGLSDILRKFSDRPGLDLWRYWSRCYDAILLNNEKGGTFGLEAIESSLRELERWPSHPRTKILVCQLALALGRAGRASDGIARLDKVIAQCERCEEWVVFAEFLRIKAELIGSQRDLDSFEIASGLLERARAMSQEQRVLTLELRTTASMCRMNMQRDLTATARDSLNVVYEKFSEGWTTSDLCDAKTLLDELAA